MIATLTKRHMTIFFRDRGAVFFSLLSPLILFLLYFLFLGNTTLDNLEEKLPFADKTELQHFLDSWIYAGVVMTAAVTTGLAALGVFVNDRESGRFVDFAVSPVPRWKVTVSYLLATAGVAAIITTVVYLVAQIHLIAQGAPVPSAEIILQTVARYLLTAVSFAALSSLVVTFVRSNGAFTSISIIVGTSIGFAAGVYVPFGLLSTGVANVLNALPFAQSAALIREPFVSQSLAPIIDGQPAAVEQGIVDAYGLEAVIGDTTLTTPMIVGILLAIGAVALVLAVGRISRKVR